jgi:predicted DNA-binding transcriptional regulator AlpA
MEQAGGKRRIDRSLKTASKAKLIRTRYFGQAASGRIRLVKDNVVMYGLGKLYPVISKRIVAGRTKVTLNPTPVRVSPVCNPQLGRKEQRIACLGRNSGREFRFIGIIESTRPLGHATDHKGKTLARTVSRTMNENIQPLEELRVLEDLELISAARRAGFDPTLKLIQICAILQESRSSIYRKIASGAFPHPVKRGRGSFWPLSQVDEYASGKWVSPKGI